MSIWIHGEDIMYCKSLYNTSAISIFKVITQVGEWIPLSLLGIYLLYSHRKAFFIAAISFIPMDIIMLLIKKSLDYPRPFGYFTHQEIMPIEGLKPLLHHSMPSGHTFTAFWTATFISCFFRINRYWQLVIFILAVLVGLSRVYLYYHFIEDILAGAWLGIIGGLIPIFIYHKKANQ